MSDPSPGPTEPRDPTTLPGAADEGAVEAEAPPSREDQWISALSDTHAPDSLPDLFAGAYDSVALIERHDAAALAQLRTVIRERLAAAAFERGLAEVTDALKAYVGLDGAYLLHWLTYADTVERFERIALDAPPDVVAFLRAAAAEHGPTLDLLQRTWLTAEDWYYIDKKVQYDMLSSRWSFEVTLSKLDGSKAHLTMSGDSVLTLVAHLLNMVAEPENPALFNDTSVSTVSDAITRFAALWDSPEEQPEGGHGAADGPDAAGPGGVRPV